MFISPELTEGPLSEMSVSKSLGVVGALTEYDVTFTLANDIPDNGLIRVIFPKNSVYKPNSGSVECSDLLDNSSPLTCSSSNHAIDSEGI